MNLNLTLFIQFIVFFIFIVFVFKFIYPRINNILNERIKKISIGLEASKKNISELKKSKLNIKKILLKAKINGLKLINDAENRANIIIENSKKKALNEALKIIDNAKIDIKKDITLAKKKIKIEIINLTIKIVEKILEKKINYKNHVNLLNKLNIKL